MPEIKSYYVTTPIDDVTLNAAIASAKNQEAKIVELFKKFTNMTNHDVYDVYNEMVGDIMPSSVGRAINTLVNCAIIENIGTIPGPLGRPVTLYTIKNQNPENIRRLLDDDKPKTIKLMIRYNEGNDIDIEAMVADLLDKVDLLNERILN